MIKAIIASLVFLSFHVSAFKVDKILFTPDIYGKGEITITNDEDKILFIDSKIEEITIDSKNNIKRKLYSKNNQPQWKIALSFPKIILRPQESKSITVQNLCKQRKCDLSSDLNFIISLFPVGQEANQSYGFAPAYILPTATPKFKHQINATRKALTVTNDSNTAIKVTANICKGRTTFDCLLPFVVIANRTKVFEFPSSVDKASIPVTISAYHAGHSYSYKQDVKAR